MGLLRAAIQRHRPLAVLTLMTVIAGTARCSSPPSHPPVLGSGSGGVSDAGSTLDAGLDASAPETSGGDGGTGGSSSGGTGPPMVACGPISAPVNDAGCNDMPCGPPVAEQYVAGGASAAVGGHIAPGNYALTELRNYTGTGGKTGPTGYLLQESFGYGSGGTYTKVTASGEVDAGVGAPARVSGTYTTSGTTITWSATCGGGEVPVSYSVIGNAFHTFFGSQEWVYTAQ